MNHSDKFWKLVNSFEPNYKTLDKSLNQAWQIIPAWQAANNNKIMLALATTNTFFIFMGNFLFVRSWFGRDINSPLPNKRKEKSSQGVMACLFIINKTLSNRIHRLGSVFLVHLGETHDIAPISFGCVSTERRSYLANELRETRVACSVLRVYPFGTRYTVHVARLQLK